MQGIEDKLLAYRAEKLDREAFFRYFDEDFYTYLFNFLKTIVGNEETADDLYQELSIRLLKKIHTYKLNTNFKAWITTLARNLALDYLKSQSVRQSSHSEIPADLRSHKPGPKTENILKESEQLTIQALSGLPPE